MAADQDKILILQVNQGNKLAFDKLFQKYYIRLCRFAYTFTKSGELAEEAVQNTFVKLWTHKDTLDITTSVMSYLFTAVRNQSLNELKKIVIRKNYESEFAETIEADTVDKTGINEKGFKNEINIAVNQLPYKCREIFMLSRYEGLTYEEIAEYLQISRKTVENQMGIAFKKLREILKPVLSKIIE